LIPVSLYRDKSIKGSIQLPADHQDAFEKGIEMPDVSIKEIRRVAHNIMEKGRYKIA
jgi:hypothetical protein